MNTMKTTVINNPTNWGWGELPTFHGFISGYVCGWCIQCVKNGVYAYTSMTCTNDFEEIRFPTVLGEGDEWNTYTDWNDLGISADGAIMNGWTITGNIVFRGYFVEDIWGESITDATEEVEALWNKYVVGVM